MEISVHYIVVEKVEEPKAAGFQSVEIQDSFVYKGKVITLPHLAVYIGDRQIISGDIVLFAKYSPDTVEMEKVKFIKISDILAII